MLGVVAAAAFAMAGAWVPSQGSDGSQGAAGLSALAQNETHPNPSLREGLKAQQGEATRMVGVPAGAARFAAFDVMVDAGVEGLAAYQVELKDAAGVAKIVGIEGGEGLYNAAPYYDPAAMQKEHVIIGALSTSAADGLPRGATRVARVHVMVEGGEPRWAAVVMTAGAVGGKKIDATVTVKASDEGAGK